MKSRNIWEIDFQGFFPSVQPELVSKVLGARVPPEIKSFFELMNESKPVFSPLAAQSRMADALVTAGSLKSLISERAKLDSRYQPIPVQDRQTQEFTVPAIWAGGYDPKKTVEYSRLGNE